MSNIFIGYIFVFFHLKINGFDLLPDFIGYILIYRGLCKLTVETAIFEKAKPATIGMGILSFMSLIVGGTINYNSLIWSVINLLATLVSIYILYIINTGIYEIEQTRNIPLNSEKLFEIWKIQSVLSIGCTVLAWIPNTIIAVIAVLLTLAAIIANIVFLVNLNNTKKIFESVN